MKYMRYITGNGIFPGKNGAKGKPLSRLEKARLVTEVARMVGAFVPVRLVDLGPDLHGQVNIACGKNGARASIQINDGLGFDQARRAALHEAFHVKFEQVERRRDLGQECEEAVKLLARLAPTAMDYYKAHCPDQVGEEAVVWLANLRHDREPLPPHSARLSALLRALTAPRAARLALTASARALVAGIMIGPLASAATAAPAGIYQVERGASVQIDAHGTCKMVTNSGPAAIMVPARSASEWSSGPASFLQNVSRMPGVSVSDCGPTPACFFWAAGIMAGDKNSDVYGSLTARIGDTSLTLKNTKFIPDWMKIQVANLVGEGEYPHAYGSDSSPGPIWNAAKTTFDSFAVGSKTKVTFYKNNDFGGGVVYEVQGPVAVVNGSIFSPAGGQGKVFAEADWSADPDPFVSQFTPSRRKFVNRFQFQFLGEDAGSLWAEKKGSFKVTCD